MRRLLADLAEARVGRCLDKADRALAAAHKWQAKARHWRERSITLRGGNVNDDPQEPPARTLIDWGRGPGVR